MDASSAAQPFDHDYLTERDLAILNFERQWWKYAGSKEQAIRDSLGMPATRYYQVLNALIDRPAALVHDPMLVRRLRRLRSARHGPRNAERLSGRARPATGGVPS